MSTLFKLIALFCLLTAAATAADPPTDPILRIETGMHTAPIKGIGVDAAERFLLTASDDKTLRLWNLATGELLTTYYVPLGKTPDEGKLYSGAISPDGEWVVGAGWTGDEWDNQYSIYLFQRANGKLVKRLSGLEDVIGHLCFSPDGQYLGATLGSLGVRIWHTQTWQLIFADRKYEDSSYWCDFDQQNRMVTTSDDGYLRLYAPQGEGFALVIPPIEAPGGKVPWAVVFSPNGDKIAVGFYDSTNVNVLDGKTLALLYAPDTTGIDNKGNNHLSSVAWSLDGNSLYAGGSYGNDLGTVVLQWPQVGQGTPYTVWQASSDTIADLRSLSNERIVYGVMDPAFAVLDSMGKKLVEKVSTIVDYRRVYQDNFGISQEGNIISFLSARFSLLEQTLIVDRSPEAKITLNANLTPQT
jgi:WD40 repeat protein